MASAVEQIRFLQYNEKRGNVHIGEYKGGNQVEWLPRVQWSPTAPKINFCETFMHQSLAYLIIHETASGLTHIGRYEGSIDIAWYTAMTWAKEFTTHLNAFQFDGRAYFLQHNRPSGSVYLGKYLRGSQLEWLPPLKWAKNYTDLLQVMQLGKDAYVIQYNSQHGNVYIGKFNGKDNFTFYTKVVWQAGFTDMLAAFQHQDEPYLIQHNKASGITYLGKYEGENTITWWKAGTWVKNYTTHLTSFQSYGDAYIVQHATSDGRTFIGKYGGEGYIAWYHGLHWVHNYTSILVVFPFKDLMPQLSDLGASNRESPTLVCSSPIHALDGTNIMEELTKLAKDVSSVKVCFDWPGSSNVVTDDAENWARVNAAIAAWKEGEQDAKEKLFKEVIEAIQRTLWFKLYVGQVKGAIKLAAQAGNKVTVSCLNGGPISQVEQISMPIMIGQVQDDLERLNVNASIQLASFETFQEFLGAIKDEAKTRQSTE